jgi:3-deoxy-D-manno-octulosonate 8-phosphate phosphatase (KDO 8-P phosphatase)
MKPNDDVLDRARKVNLVLMDVDGVLTDGRILMYSDGTEGRAFSARDGHGIRMGQRGGLLFGIVSGRDSKVVSDRAEELYITEVHQGIFDKIERYREILERFQLPPESVCYIGDDLVDVPVLREVGLAVAPANGEQSVRDLVHWVTPSGGGDGAVRDTVDLLLRAKGKWESVTDRYFK